MNGSEFTIVSYGLSAILCVLMVTELLRGFRANGTTLPSFVALTTLTSLAFCMFCLFASLGVKAFQSDSRIIFIIYLLIPFGLGFCLLMSGIAFLIVKTIPSLSNVILSDTDKKAKTRVIRTAMFCTGLVLACTVFITG